jgi:hypothetical protein
MRRNGASSVREHATGGAWFGTRIFRFGHAEDMAPGIYGTVISASVLAAVDETEPIWTVVVTVVVTVLVYWFAERYSMLLAVHMRGHTAAGRIGQVLRQGWRMVEASYTPVLVLVLFWSITGSVADAIAAALYYTTGLLVALGWLAGRRNGQSGWALIRTMAFVGALGVVIIALKLTLH